MQPVTAASQTGHGQRPQPQGQRSKSYADAAVPGLGTLTTGVKSLPQAPYEAQGSAASLRAQEHRNDTPPRREAGQGSSISTARNSLCETGQTQCFCLPNESSNNKRCSTGQAHACISSSGAMRSASVTCWLVRKGLFLRNLSSSSCSSLSMVVLLHSTFSLGT